LEICRQFVVEFPRFEIVRFEVEANPSTRSAEVEAKPETERYVEVARVVVPKFTDKFIKVEEAVAGTKIPTRVEVGVRYLQDAPDPTPIVYVNSSGMFGLAQVATPKTDNTLMRLGLAQVVPAYSAKMPPTPA